MVVMCQDCLSIQDRAITSPKDPCANALVSLTIFIGFFYRLYSNVGGGAAFRVEELLTCPSGAVMDFCTVVGADVLVCHDMGTCVGLVCWMACLMLLTSGTGLLLPTNFQKYIRSQS